MENTQTFQFPNDQAEWFYAVGENYRGPFKGQEIYQKLQSKELSWIDYVYRETEGQWMRIADHPLFKSLQPSPPKPKPTITPPPPPLKTQPEIRWFLFQNDTQTGPYPTAELIRLRSAGQILATAYVWQEQFKDWKPYSEVAELKAPTSPANPGQSLLQPAVPAQPSDKRAAPRKPLTAHIYLTNQQNLAVAVCRDISVGGMQVLTEQIPGPVGTSIRLNVAPPTDSGLAPFVAEGVVVRLLEDRRGFSFRFTKISDEAKKSIESYIA